MAFTRYSELLAANASAGSISVAFSGIFCYYWVTKPKRRDAGVAELARLESVCA